MRNSWVFNTTIPREVFSSFSEAAIDLRSMCIKTVVMSFLFGVTEFTFVKWGLPFVLHAVLRRSCAAKHLLYSPDLLICHVWRETVEEKGSQRTIISTIKVKVDRNSTIISSTQRFSFTFIYLQRTHTNFSNSPEKAKETP